MNRTTFMWQGYIFISYQTPKLDAVSGLLSHNIAGVLVPASFEFEALTLNPRILQPGDKNDSSATDIILTKQDKVFRFFFIVLSLFIQTQSSITNLRVQRAKHPRNRKIANVGHKPVSVSIFRVQNYCLFSKPLCNISSKICIFSSKWLFCAYLSQNQTMK